MRSLKTNNLATLLLCALIPIALLLRLNLSGSAHMDEYDYLFVGKTLLSGNDWPTHSYIFGWDLSWLVLAWGETTFGGLEGARLITTLLGLVSMLGMYCFVHSLWHKHAISLIAVLLLSLEAAHIYTSALATYDIICFTAFVWSLPVLVNIFHSTQPKPVLTLVASILLCLAVLSKYVLVVYLPFIAAILFFQKPGHTAAGMLILCAVLGSYLVLHFDQLHVLYNVQIRGAHEANANAQDILRRTLNQQGVLLALAVVASTHAAAKQPRQLALFVVLLAGSVPLFLYHLLNLNVISLQKHLVFTSLFLIPIIAWWLHYLLQKALFNRFHYVTVCACIVLFAIFNLKTLSVMRASFPNMHALASHAKDMQINTSVLSEDPYLFRYLLYDKSDQSLIKESNWFDNNMDGVREHRDIKQAVWDMKFDYVFLNDQLHKQLNTDLRRMLALRNYTTVLDESYNLQTLSGQNRSGRLSLYAKPASIASATTEP